MRKWLVFAAKDNSSGIVSFCANLHYTTFNTACVIAKMAHEFGYHNIRITTTASPRNWKIEA